MTMLDEPRALGEPAVDARSPDPLLAAFAASRAGFDCPEVRWDDDASPDPLLEGALHAGGPEGRVVQLAVLSGRVADSLRIERLLGAPVPHRTIRAAELLVAVLGLADARVGIDLVVDGAGVWWLAG